MESPVPVSRVLSVDDAAGEYAVLSPKLGRRTKNRNDAIQHKLRYTSFCLENQRKKFTSYHTTESAKHQAALLNFRRNLKKKSWLSDSLRGSSPDVFAADSSHLSPVELSRFQLMKQTVAGIPGDVVTIEHICRAINRIGRIYTVDKDNKAVPIRFHQQLTKPAFVVQENKECGNKEEAVSTSVPSLLKEGVITKKTNGEIFPPSCDQNDVKRSTHSSYVGTSAPLKEALNISETGDQIDRTTQTTKVHFENPDVHGSVQSQVVSDPVFITEVNSTPLQVKNRGSKKHQTVRVSHPLWKTVSKTRETKAFKKAKTDRVSAKTNESTGSVVSTVRFGNKRESMQKREIHKVQQTPESETNLKHIEHYSDGRPPARLSGRFWNQNDSWKRTKSDDEPPLQHSRPSSRGSSTSKYTAAKPNKTRGSDGNGKRITWKEPVATTNILVNWENKEAIRNEDKHSVGYKAKYPPNFKGSGQELSKTSNDLNVTYTTSTRSLRKGLPESQSGSRLPSANNPATARNGKTKQSRDSSRQRFLLLYRDTEGICKRHS